VEIGYKCRQADHHNSLILQCYPLAVFGSQGTSKEERKKKQASHVISIGFLKGGLDAI
jgi:hypothetical protein